MPALVGESLGRDQTGPALSQATSHLACDYCGLPVYCSPACSSATHDHDTDCSTSSQDAELSLQREESPPVYCCQGCRFAASITRATGDAGQARGLMVRLGLSLFFTMNVMAFTMYLWTQEGVPASAAAATFYDIGRYICLLFATPVLLLLAGPLVEDALAELRRGSPSMSGLLVAGVVAAYAYSVASVIRDEGHVYFEVTCMVLVAVTLGRWLEAQGKLQTTAALRSLQKLLPDEVRLLTTGGEELVSRASIKAGDRLRLLAGDRIPVDATVERGSGSIDQQAVTGESEPVVKQSGDMVYSGTLNLDGEFVIVAAGASDEGTMQRIITAVARAVARDDHYQRLAVKISTWFFPTVLVIAAATFAWHGYRSGLAEGLLAALAVVVIACPCALGLATPMALWAAVGRAARNHVLIRDGDTLDKLAHAAVFGFDKTGTLTTGSPRVCEVEASDGESVEQVIARAAAVAQASNHPLSTAIVEEATRRGISINPTAQTRTLPGRGLIGVDANGGETIVGSPRLLRESLTERAIDLDSIDDSPAGPWVGVAWDGRPRGVIRFAESIRPSAGKCVEWLVRQGLCVEVLTGDRVARAKRLAEQLGVPVHGDQLPEDKLVWVESSRGRGRVVMVGDGINDAPALAAADVGVALAAGADVSRHTASVCLLGNDLTRIPWLVQLARRTNAVIRWNLFWAFAYNTVGIAIAAAGWLNPILAAVAMTVSSLLVVGNSLRLGREPLEGDVTESQMSDALTTDLATDSSNSLNRYAVSAAAIEST
jgi:heavy metal translocating P-type ATPase